MNDSDASRSAVQVAVVAQLVATAYLQIVEWVPLFPWNDIRRGNGQEMLDIAMLAPQLLLVLAFVRRSRAGMIAGLVAYAGWLVLQIESWWVPYLFGTRTVGPRWWFADTYKFLPQIDARPTPDANHIVLQFILVAVLVTGFGALRAVQRSQSVTGPSKDARAY